MIPGFERIVEERIRQAMQGGRFDHLRGAGAPLLLENDAHIPEDLRLVYKILKNADCLPPEIEIRKEIHQTEELLAGVLDAAEKYRTIKKLNYLIMKLNTLRSGHVTFELPQHYSSALTERLSAKKL